jgi:D-amino-acid dehydrogenase
LKQILVIGGGVVGLCTAYYCSQKGHQVTVIERRGPDYEGCSFGNAGLVVPSHFVPLAAPGMVALGLKWMWNPESPFYIKPRLDWDLLSWCWKFYRAANPAHVTRSAPLLRDLNVASRVCYEELASDSTYDFQLVKKGCLNLCRTEHRLEEEAKVAAVAHQLGVPAEVLDRKQTTALEPNVHTDIVGAVYFPTDCHLTPQKFVLGMRERLLKENVKILWSTEATGWRAERGRVTAVQTSHGDFSAEEYVICSGAWSPVVARDLKLQLPMQAGKGYSLTISQPRRSPRIPAILTEARVAVTPMGSSLRFGGTMEIAGLNEDLNPARVRGILKSVPRYYPDFTADDFREVPVWRGLRPCSPDGVPYVGRTGQFSNLAIATGHAMMGLSLGPISGRLIAELLSGEKPSLDIQLLDPDRYA